MVLYFTGTGNSRYVAEQIAKALDDELISANDIIKNGEAKEFNSEKPYVMVAPVHGWRVPVFLEKFFNESNFNGSMRFYTIVTCGESSGDSYKFINKVAIANNVKLKGFAEIAMPNNYVMLYDVQTVEEAKEDIVSQKKLIDRIIESIKNDEEFLINNGSSIKKNLLSSAGYNVFQKFVVTSKHFHTDENCNLCGNCVNFCPFNNIKVDNKVTWGQKCHHCCSCISQCPKKAIQYKNVTQNRKRYYLPDNTYL